MTLSFRLCTEADIERADIPFSAAYGFTESKKALLHQYWLLQTDGWWLALLDEQPVGFGGAVDYGPFSFIGMIAVHPSVQHRGIGTAIMHHILAWGEARACPTMVLNATADATAFYRRLGFSSEGKTFQFRQNHIFSLPKPVSAISRLQDADLSDLAAFDVPYFGADRAHVLASHLHENPDSAFVSRTSNGQITGYLFSEPGFLGPWVASTSEVAEQLLVRVLSLPFQDPFSVTLPETNQDGQHLLKRYGFRHHDSNTFMRRGALLPQRRGSKIYGEASAALG